MYMFTLRSACPGIENTRNIALSVRSGHLCADKLGDVMFRDYMGSRSCPIIRIEKVASDEHAARLVDRQIQEQRQ